MIMRRAISTGLFWACLAAVTFTAAGCSFKKAYPAKQSFLIEARRSGEPVSSSLSASGILVVGALQVATPFEGKSFVYRDSELRYEADFYHEFLVAPRALITEQVRRWLGASGLFHFVVDASSRSEPTHHLDGNVTALYGDFRDPASPKAVIALEFFLSKEKSGSGEIVFHSNYRQEMAIVDRAPETLARGWGKGLEQILAAFEQDLARAPSIPR